MNIKRVLDEYQISGGRKDQFFLIMDTMPWEDLLAEVYSTDIRLTTAKNTICQRDGTVFFDNPDNRTVKLLFYDLSGKMILEASTTSNSYRPSLEGGIYVCCVRLNNELQTIKYIAR